MDCICKRCGRTLPESEFYDNDTTCKDCRREVARLRYAERAKNPEFLEKERERGREKYHRLHYVEKKTERKARKESKYTSLRNAKRDFHVSLSRDIELHHWNYNITDCVFVLEKRLHRRLHQSITLNMDEGIYYKGQERLDSVSKHYDVVLGVCRQYGFDSSKIKVLRK